MNKKFELERKIDNVRNELYELSGSVESFTDSQLIMKSEELDRLLNEYQSYCSIHTK